MLKTARHGTVGRSPDGAETPAGTSNTPSRSSSGVVHCFVELDELRRLLSLMAGTELVSELIQNVLG